LCQLASQQAKRSLGRGNQIALTHEQIAALTGTSHETATKILDDYADRGLVRLGRGKLTILDAAAIAAETGDSPARVPHADRFSRDRGLH
jgi:CRP-like cAMP-binding protein